MATSKTTPRGGEDQEDASPRSTNTVRVLVADGHEVVRKALRALLESTPCWKVVAEAVDSREAVEKARRLRPEIVIVDFSIPSLNGLEVTRQIRRASPDTAVLILTLHDSDELAREILEAGAGGYMLKCDAGGELVTAVEAVHERRPYFASRAPGIFAEGYDERAASTACARDGIHASRSGSHTRHAPAGRGLLRDSR